MPLPGWALSCTAPRRSGSLRSLISFQNKKRHIKTCYNDDGAVQSTNFLAISLACRLCWLYTGDAYGLGLPPPPTPRRHRLLAQLETNSAVQTTEKTLTFSNEINNKYEKKCRIILPVTMLHRSLLLC